MAEINGRQSLLLALKGDKGDTVYIRYAIDSSGTDMSETYNGQAYLGTYIGSSASDNPSDYTWMNLGGGNREKYDLFLNDEQNATLLSETPTITLTSSQIDGVLANVNKDLIIYANTSWENHPYPAIHLAIDFSCKGTDNKVSFISHKGSFINLATKKIYTVYSLIDKVNSTSIIRLEYTATY